jgi:predicted RNA polymerase sigma factor
MDTYYLLHATRADLLRRAGRMPEAAESYRLAAYRGRTPFSAEPAGPADGSPGGQ